MIIVQLLISVTFIHFDLAKYTICLDIKQVYKSSFLIDINSAQQQTNNTLRLQNFYNYLYVGQIRVLSKDLILKFKVIFDTGLSQIVKCQRCNKNQIVIVCEQLTFIPSLEQASITYHIGALTGIKCLGMVSINEHFDESQFILVDEVAGIIGATYEGEQQDYNNNLIILLQWPIKFYYNFVKSNLILRLEVMMRVYLIKKQDMLYLDVCNN